MAAMRPRHGEDDDSCLRGFFRAMRIMFCHQARTRVHERLEITSFPDDGRIAAVHVDNTTRADRVFLTAFDRDGRRIGSDTLYVDDPAQRLDVVPEFDSDFTSMGIVHGSDLAAAVARADGWVVDMSALRRYDPSQDRRSTQRAVFMEHLADMMASGQIDAFLLGGGGSDGDQEGLL